MSGSWKRKRILSKRIDFKQLEKCESWKVAKYSSSNDVWCQLAREYYNLSYKPILSKVQRFQYLCRKAETKSVIHQLKTKERVLLILSEKSNNFNVYNYTSTTILPSQNMAICRLIFLVTWQICFLKMETINCYGVKKWVNGKTRFLEKVLNCFLVWKFVLLKNRYLAFENLVFMLIWSRKRHMWGILWQHQ